MGVEGIGISLIEIGKFKARMSGKAGISFLANTFTSKEISYADATDVEKFAVAFAIKDAVHKAFEIEWTDGRDVEISRRSRGKPTVKLHGKIESIADRRKIKKILIDTCRSEGFVMAVVVPVSA